jgi:death-on-curing protein
MSWTSVDIDEVYEIHQALFRRKKIKASVRDFGLLHSAVERPKATFAGQELYPSIFAKAGALLQSLTLDPPFTDGNKRTAWLSTRRLLYLNNLNLKPGKMDAVEFMLQVDNDKISLRQISLWLKKNSIRIKE